VEKPRVYKGIKNKLEEDFEIILEENFPNKWKYGGTGEIVIAHKYPDFVNEAEKKIIEVFGDFWHKNDSGYIRKSIFKDYGYSMMIVWEHEIREDLLSVLEKVSEY
jgi:very-short-patch-repair endonuclease